MTTPKADSDCQVPYRLSDAIGRTRSRSRSSNHATGRGSMARADPKTTQLRLISVGAIPYPSLWRPLAGRHASGVPLLPGPAEAAPDAVFAAIEAYRAASTNLDAQVGLYWVLEDELPGDRWRARISIWHENTVACGDCSLLYA